MASIVSYPSAWVHLHLLLENLGQPEPDRLIQLAMRPLEMRVERNSFQEADTIDLTIDGEDFPFDPRALRGVTVEAFLASTEGVDPGFWDTRSPDQLRELAVFAGVIDESESTFDDEHRKFRLRGRDYTAYFLDAELAAKATEFSRGGRKLSLKESIEELLVQRPQTEDLEVDDRDGVGAQIFPSIYRRHGGTGKEGQRKSRDGETLWDVIQEVALEAGVIVYVELDQVVIRRPTTLFLDRPDVVPPRTFTLGRDVALLRYARRLGRQHGISVQVTSFDPDTATTRAARGVDPQTGATRRVLGATRIGAGDPPVLDEEVPVRPFAVRGITDPTQLQTIADQLLELLRHHEVEGEIDIHEFTDTNGRALQDVAFGDPVAVQISPDAQGFGFLPLDAQVRALVEKGYPDKDAQKIVIALDALNVPFYVHRATHRFDAKGDGAGYVCTIEFRGRKQVQVAA